MENSISSANIVTINGENTDSGTDSDSDSGVTVKGGILYVDSDFEGDEIKLADYNVNNINESARTKKIHLVRKAKANTLIGGSGNDTPDGVESTKKYSANVAELDEILDDKFAVAEFEKFSSHSPQVSSLNITFAK